MKCNTIYTIITSCIIIVVLILFIGSLILYVDYIYFDKFVPSVDYYNTKFYNNVKNGPIDVVYRWVDTTIPSWIKQKNKYLIEGGFKPQEIDISAARWTVTNKPHDEIELSIRSVKKYMPWVNNIFVITQRPQKLPQSLIEEFNLITIHHDEYIPQTAKLPTFQAMLLEKYCYKIKNLSECFIMFDDDMYINKPMKDTDWFINNIPIVRYNKRDSYGKKLMSYEALTKDIGAGGVYTSNLYRTDTALRNNNMVFFQPIHHPKSVTKSMYSEMNELFKNEPQFLAIDNERFRTRNQMSPSYATTSIGINRRKVFKIKHDPIKHIFMEKFNKKLINDQHLICVNSVQKESIDEMKEIILNN
jgi:hypothetical protein